VPCLLCGRTYKLSVMRNHVGWHILYMMRSLEDPFGLLNGQKIGADPCGFCGLDSCRTQLTKTGKKVSITSSCPYHHAGMKYNLATQTTTSTPCTNVPIHCPLC
ncbi:uncharacterized protein STEHIDRAFT_41835, partial [Stereum hirsutum FP-91666 SS1]|uniref:uncharacterized protein n=1 Tax=Stereum hirsutum (strain FP-91666) TaxID=721885 RepID=UPI00044493D8